MNHIKPPFERYIIVDVMRGLAVVLMTFYHLVFDLNRFHLVRIDILGHPFWYGLPRFIVTIILLCVGLGLALAHKKGLDYARARRRLYVIGAWAIVISIVTYTLYPKNFVFFGILHCIFMASIIGLFFVGRPKASLVIGLLAIVPCLIFDFTIIPVSDWLGVKPMDYEPLYPRFGVVLVGIFLESIGMHKIPISRVFPVRLLEKMGRHSLKIYIIHRPVVMGLVLGLYRLNL